MDTKRVLVTGASGFVGGNLVPALVNRGAHVFAISRNRSSDDTLIRLGAEPVRADLAHDDYPVLAKTLPQVEWVFHLAGQLSGNPAELNRVNVEGSRKIATVCASWPQSPIFVSLSSVAAGGPSSQQAPRDETDIPNPISNYGKSKLAGERAIAKFFSAMPISIVRPGIIFGPGDREFNRLLQSMHRVYLNPLIRGGRQPLAIIEVADLIRLLIAVAENGERVSSHTDDGDPTLGTGVYYAAATEPISLRQLGAIFSSTLQRPVIPLPVIPSVAWLIGLLGEQWSFLTKTKSTLNRDKIREALANGWWVDVSKAVSQLNWKPRNPIEEEMRHWIRRAKEQRLL
jgi:nucleoside-diphosphate-sugar epimerase